MKNILFFIPFLVYNISVSQSSFSSSTTQLLGQTNTVGSNGFDFEVVHAGKANSKYSEFGTGFFKKKFILVSSKKIGGLSKVYSKTNEAQRELYCLDTIENGMLELPILFSRILNTHNSEDQLAFAPNQKTIYFTRSSVENPAEYKLYKADLEKDSHGNWINQEMLDINKENVSIENPFINSKGNKLYFSSNMKDSHGGHDIYMSRINSDGTLSTPENLGSKINTSFDEKYPSLSKNENYLYLASKGHENIGGYDVLRSRITKNGYKAPMNLGNTINTEYDEVAFFKVSNTKAYLSSNKPGGKGSYDVYIAKGTDAAQTLKGDVVDSKTKIVIPNALVILKDEDGNEILRQLTNDNGGFNFDVDPLEAYKITLQKKGYNGDTSNFVADKISETTYDKSFELVSTEPEIIVNEDLSITIENIYFDFDKWSIRDESFPTLDKIVNLLNENAINKLAINAYTDNAGSNNYNIKLSKKRAKSAVKYLVKKGIKKNRLEPKGYGEEFPKIDCKLDCTPQEDQENRRVEFIILD